MSPLVPELVLRMDAEGRSAGSFSGAALFIDIPGFTQLTETLVEHGRAGAEALARTLRFYFDPLIAAVHDAGGFVASFAGDAFTALFPSPEPEADREVAAYALRAALEMRRLFDEHPERETPFGTFPFSFKIALSWGAVGWGIVRASASRRYFYFQGPAIEASTAIEHLAQGGDILLDDAFAERAGPLPLDEIPGHAARRLVTCLAPALPPCPRAPTPEGGALFVDPAVASAPLLGEFRNVASVFLAFSPVGAPDAPGYPELTCLLHELATLYGGTFTGLDSGDKGTTALVHFGAPISHENDAERALDFALEMRSRARPPLRVRAGVTCDVRYAGFNGGTERHDYACIGRATNLAARLLMAAPWGEIWCDDQVVGSVDDHYQWSSRRARRFKGFEYAVQVYALERRRVSVQRQISELGLIGREAELRRLRAIVRPLLDPTAGAAPARVVYIEGENGIGKSYLVEHFHAELRRAGPGRLLWLDARCDQTIRSSLNAVEYAMRQYFLSAAWVDREERRARFEQGFQGLLRKIPDERRDLREELARARHVFAALVGLPRHDRPGDADAGAARVGVALGGRDISPPSRRRFEEILRALALFFQAECAARPVVLHLEDAHWADEGSLAAVSHVARSCRDLPLAILCTSRRRDDGTPVRLDDADAHAELIELAPLGVDQLEAIASAVFGGAVPQMITGILRDNAGGNPLYAQEILSYWLADKGQTMSSITGTFSPPRSIMSLLVARLDRLEPGVRATVQAASVLGREFDLRILGWMLPDPSVLERHVRAGELQCIWVPLCAASDDPGYALELPASAPAPAHAEGEGAPVSERRYRFTSVLLCNAAYEMQSRARLGELHQRAAEAILGVHGRDVEDHLTALARHFYRAGAFDEAQPYFLAAARKAEERDAHDEAARLYRAHDKIIRGEVTRSMPPMSLQEVRIEEAAEPGSRSDPESSTGTMRFLR